MKLSFTFFMFLILFSLIKKHKTELTWSETGVWIEDVKKISIMLIILMNTII